MNLKLQPFLPSGFDPQEGRHLLKETIDLAWPATVESIFVGLASLVDTIMVSTLGTTAIAAIGLTNQPKFIAIAFIASLNVGITAIISRRIGAAGRRQYLSAAVVVDVRADLGAGLRLIVSVCPALHPIRGRAGGHD